MQKNTAGKWVVFAFGNPSHASAGLPITGDAANITANIRIDGGAANAVDDTNPTELEDGFYVFDVTAAETNGDQLTICPASSTANVLVIGSPASVFTTPADFPNMSILPTGQVGIDFNNINTPAGAIPSLGIIDNGTGQAATATTFQLRSGATFADDTIIGSTLMVLGSTQGYWQSRIITDHVLSTDTVTVDTFTVTPSGTLTYFVVATPPASSNTAVIPAVNVTEVGGSAQDLATATALATVDTNVDSILVDTGTTIPAQITALNDFDPTTDTVANVTTVATTTTNTDMRGTDSAATAVALATVDTNVDAIKVKTDELTFTKSNELDANTQSINGASVVGDGNATPWDGA